MHVQDFLRCRGINRQLTKDSGHSSHLCGFYKARIGCICQVDMCFNLYIDSMLWQGVEKPSRSWWPPCYVKAPGSLGCCAKRGVQVSQTITSATGVNNFSEARITISTPLTVRRVQPSSSRQQNSIFLAQLRNQNWFRTIHTIESQAK